MKSATSVGVDGWSVQELKALPDSVLERLCVLLNAVDRLGEWPRCLKIGLVTMIGKGEGLLPRKLRPISVMSVLYRIWASFHMRHIVEWQEEWASSSLFGFRPHRGCEDAFWDTALEIEYSLLSGEDIAGCSIDLQKAFDRVPRDIVFAIAAHMGFPPQVLGALRNMHDELDRHFRVGMFVGRAFRSTRGILQGCPLSVALLNIIMEVWCRLISSKTGARPKCYADDATAIARGGGCN